MLPFYIPWKHTKKTRSFLVFSGGAKWEHWPEMGEGHISKFSLNIKPFCANPQKWPNILKQFFVNCQRITWVCLTIRCLTISPISVLWKRCAEKMQQIYRTTFYKDTYGGLLLTSYASDPNSKLLNVNLLPDPF